MKKCNLRFKVFLIAGLCAVTGIVLFWMSDEGRFDGYDMVKWVDIGDPFGRPSEPAWHEYVPDVILDWFERDDGRGDDYYDRIHLTGRQQDELKRIFEPVDLLHDGVSVGPPPFIGAFGMFLLPIDGEPYLLNLYYSGPVPGGYYDAKELSLGKVRITRQGKIESVEDRETRFFSSPELYDRLERFLRELPESNEARQEYDRFREFMQKTADEFEKRNTAQDRGEEKH